MFRAKRDWMGFVVCLAGLLCFGGWMRGQVGSRPHVDLIELKDVFINQVLVGVFERALETAERDKAECLVIQFSSPGGEVFAMQEIVQKMLNADVPIVVYVAPRGAYAYSAGTFVLMAAHIAAMAPASSTGAAHPIMISPPAPDEGGGKGESPQERIMMQKVTNAISASIRGIAEERGRNVKWAEKAVRQSLSASAKEAKRLKVIDIVCEDIDDLLRQINGRKVNTAGGTRVLHTRDAKVHRISMTAKESFLSFLNNPNIAYLLLMLAIMGFLFELYNPGAIVPGLIGGIAFILFLFSASVLPINWVGFLLILFGFGLLIAEIKIVSHGILTIFGIASLLLGGYMLVDIKNPRIYADYFRVSFQVLGTSTVLFAGFVVFAVQAAWRAHQRKATTGAEGLVGKVGVARSPLNTEGTVFVDGSYWSAECVDGPVEEGARVEVIAVQGLRLRVRQVKEK